MQIVIDIVVTARDCPDLTIAATWIAEVERERKRVERELGRKPTSGRLTKAGIKALVRQLKDIVAVLADVVPDDRRAIYAELGVNLTYQPDGRMLVEVRPRRPSVCVEGAKNSPSTRDPWDGWLTAA